MSFDQIRQLIEEDMAAVDRVIRTQLHSDVVLVRQVSEYIIHSGGKRLRPVLTLLAAKALGYAGTHHHTLAAVVEFIHTATLLHDDVVDKSEMRRGQKTANELFGNAASVLVGDFVYSRSFQMMVSVGDMRVMQVLADATNVIAEGEVLQLLNCHDPDVDEARYLQVIRYKTAKLFEAAARLGALLAGAPDAVEQGLAAFGAHLGTAFQIIDDVLDYSGDLSETGKNLGDDLAEGKATLPLIHVMREGPPADAALIRNAIVEGGGQSLPAVAAVIRESGALDYARDCAQRESDAACAALKGIMPDSPYRDALEQLAHLAVNRSR
ncbi:MAG: octaprenyl diphosphate synthase [Betaproteobacteria bacterium]|nr:octaprenyl diphosphate synthase [Betaproteobacteria bacterium]MDE1981890.1 octaprenyl diphosphate synthase [Betaproteobacteria bacterium]MDE2211840.1 octaprenyl diphosphate synthase [Betaproteobacteria bacterium]MDE2623842.1 octaprenyl diphosphate synthase [Betaproteobacteria bacterium]